MYFTLSFQFHSECRSHPLAKYYLHQFVVCGFSRYYIGVCTNTFIIYTHQQDNMSYMIKYITYCYVQIAFCYLPSHIVIMFFSTLVIFVKKSEIELNKGAGNVKFNGSDSDYNMSCSFCLVGFPPIWLVSAVFGT